MIEIRRKIIRLVFSRYPVDELGLVNNTVSVAV